MAAASSISYIDQARIIFETIDEETLVIDTQSGAYYILRGSGATIWQMLSQGVALPSLLDALGTHYGAMPAALQPAVVAFLTELQEAGLITLPTMALTTAVAPLDDARAAQVSSAFTPPVLHRFTDMHDLLLIDPIHEVTDGGWPFAAAAKVA